MDPGRRSSVMPHPERLANYIAGAWRASAAAEWLEVRNPASAQVLAAVPLSPPEEVDQAAGAAARAFPDWRRTPAGERVQPLFRLKALLEEHGEELARTITAECGKTLAESRGELRRAVENLETACGVPSLMQGYNSEEIAPGVDEFLIRQPLGPVAVIAPFNFPGMIAFWFLPYAVACGNTVIVKPSERTPLTMQQAFCLMERAGFPPGVVNLLHGARATVEALVDHPAVRAVSFVGSTAAARQVYARAAGRGKRAQCHGGAKNLAVVLPDADLESAVPVLADSAFGCAGQRCLAVSLAVAVGAAAAPLREALASAAAARVTGCGLDPGVEMGPVISAESKARIEGLVARALQEGARAVVDGRNPRIPGYEQGYFVRPTVVEAVDPDSELARTEVFGPVLGLLRAETLEQALALINRGPYGNMACLFTTSGLAARRFRCEAEAGNIGINVGVAAPMAFFPFSGWKESFFGDLHGQGRDAVEFFTQQKVVVERWPKLWSRKF
jgi:malonate-semialdehyde dehydrogenase (acetylating)/methylmalonate-semialdehyde dehydrogenase